MIDFLFSIGQAASAVLVLYGAYLVLMPVRKTPALTREFVLLRHQQNDA